MEITKTILDEMNTNSLYQTFGIRILAASGGRAKSRLEPNSDLCWPFPGQPHGGVLFTLMDTTMAWAVWSQLDAGLNCTTVNIDIHYTMPAKGNIFKCSAWSAHKTGRTSFVRAEIFDGKDHMVAMGQATFRIIPVDLLK